MRLYTGLQFWFNGNLASNIASEQCSKSTQNDPFKIQGMMKLTFLFAYTQIHTHTHTLAIRI